MPMNLVEGSTVKNIYIFKFHSNWLKALLSPMASPPRRRHLDRGFLISHSNFTWGFHHFDDFLWWSSLDDYDIMINNRGGAKNAYVAIRSQHKFMLQLHVAITYCDLMLQSDVHFSVGFPVFAVKYFSKLEFCIYDCLFLGWISRLRC